MIPGWMIANVLWVGLAFLVISAITGRRYFSGLGWLFFGIHWVRQPGYYLDIGDYFNVVLTILVALVSFYMAWIILVGVSRSRSCDWASSAVAIGGLIYFPFAEFAPLKEGLIGQTTHITVLLLEALQVPVSTIGFNEIYLNGYSVEVILTCTAIESIALFAGVIISVKAPLWKRTKALMVSVPVIYILNLFRNAFVMIAYGNQWFGADSFQVAHNEIAKLGSTIALFLIAYWVLVLLPELLDMIDELIKVLRHPRGGTD